MCDDDHDYHEEDDLDFDESEPPGRIKYRQADKPVPLAERLAYFKYDKQYHKSMRELMRYFCLDPAGKRKPKLILLNIKDESYVFVPVNALHEQSVTNVEWMGHTMSFAGCPPTFVLTTTLYHSDEKKIWAKYQALSEAVFKGDEMRPVNIGGMLFYLSDMDAQFGTAKHSRETITIKFTAVSDYQYGKHTRLRHYEHEIQKRFGRFIKCESNQ
jgi:hypothetical protein